MFDGSITLKTVKFPHCKLAWGNKTVCWQVKMPASYSWFGVDPLLRNTIQRRPITQTLVSAEASRNSVHVLLMYKVTSGHGLTNRTQHLSPLHLFVLVIILTHPATSAVTRDNNVMSQWWPLQSMKTFHVIRIYISMDKSR